MGCCCDGCSDDADSKVRPVTSTSETISSDESDQVFVKRRSCTDLIALIILVVVIAFYGFLISTVVKKGDIFRIINGYDDCANVCGRVTKFENDPKFSCKGADMTKLPYLMMTAGVNGIKTRTCVANCDPKVHVIFLNRCIPRQVSDSTTSLIKSMNLQNFFYEAASDLCSAWHELVYLLLIALAISLGILIAFRYLVAYIIYLVLAGAVFSSNAGAGYLWYTWYDEKKAVKTGKIHEEDASVTDYLIYSILMTILAVITTLVVLVMRKRIALVMQLFREAGKAVAFMPVILLQPVYTYALVGVSLIAWIFCMLWIESAGDLYVNRKNHFHYKKDTYILVARWYNFFVFYVMCEFFLGCQHMVIAGAVSRWFFKRDKSRLSFAVIRSFCTLMRYHLGTVAFGAMVIGLVRLIRTMLSFIQNRLKKFDNQFVKGILWCCHCCLWCFECALKFLTRNAYIETAIYGCNFCTGGKKAFQALSNNILRVAAINSVGDFVLFLGKILVVALTIVAGVYLMQKKHGLHHPWVPIAVAAFFAFIVAHCFISIYEMVIDTIFICFCEDCAKNDGVTRPYFMSRRLMEFVENSKKALQLLEKRERSGGSQ